MQLRDAQQLTMRCRRFRLRLGELFRIQAGFAVLFGAVTVLYRVRPELHGRVISPIEFTFVTSSVALVSYAACRCVFSRFTCPLVGVIMAGVAGIMFARPKVDNPLESAMLGMCVAFSWIVGLGWLDRRNDRPRRVRTAVHRASCASRECIAKLTRAAAAKLKAMHALSISVPSQSQRGGRQRREGQGAHSGQQEIQGGPLRGVTHVGDHNKCA